MRDVRKDASEGCFTEVVNMVRIDKLKEIEYWYVPELQVQGRLYR